MPAKSMSSAVMRAAYAAVREHGDIQAAARATGVSPSTMDGRQQALAAAELSQRRAALAVVGCDAGEYRALAGSVDDVGRNRLALVRQSVNGRAMLGNLHVGRAVVCHGGASGGLVLWGAAPVGGVVCASAPGWCQTPPRPAARVTPTGVSCRISRRSWRKRRGSRAYPP
jgi:hypothetical protein